MNLCDEWHSSQREVRSDGRGPGITLGSTRSYQSNKCIASSNKCLTSSNKCLTSSNKKLLGTSASLLGTSALLVDI